MDSSSAIRASGTATRRACSRSSAATVCRLFFTRWWISRIVASLLMICRSRRRSSVTSCISSSAPSVSPRGRSGMRAEQHRRSPALDLDAGRLAAVDRGFDRLGQVAGVERVVGDGAGQLVQRLADDRAGDAEPAERRQRVRAGVDDRAVRLEAQQAVADARAGALLVAGVRVREGAVGDHRRQVGGGLQVDELELAGRAHAGQVGVLAQHGDDGRSGRPARIGMASRRIGRSPSQSGSVSRKMRPSLQRGAQRDGPLAARDHADLVVLVGGRPGRRAALRGAEEGGVAAGVAVGQRDRHPEQQVGEGQIREQLPLADQPLQMGDLLVVESGA